MKIQFQKISDDAIIPFYAREGDAGMDIFSDEDVVLEVGERKRIKTGIKMKLSDGCVGLVWDKSGVAFNDGVKTMAGVFDSGYRGEVLIVLVNLGKNSYKVAKGQKVAQMLIQKVERVEVEIVDEVDKTERGENGFGSTGIFGVR